MISIKMILLFYVTIGFALSMVAEKYAIKREREVIEYCNELKKLVAILPEPKNGKDDVPYLRQEMFQELKESEMLLRRMIETRENLMGFVGTMVAMVMWPIFIVGIAKRVVFSKLNRAD